MNIMLTMGKKAAAFPRKRGEIVRLGACHVDAVDTTAAGDTFIGYFVRGIVQNLSMRDTLRQATVASDCREFQTRRGGRCSGAQRSARLAIAGNDLINGHEGGDRASFCLRQNGKQISTMPNVWRLPGNGKHDRLRINIGKRAGGTGYGRA